MGKQIEGLLIFDEVAPLTVAMFYGDDIGPHDQRADER